MLYVYSISLSLSSPVQDSRVRSSVPECSTSVGRGVCREESEGPTNWSPPRPRGRSSSKGHTDRLHAFLSLLFSLATQNLGLEFFLFFFGYFYRTRVRDWLLCLVAVPFFLFTFYFIWNDFCSSTYLEPIQKLVNLLLCERGSFVGGVVRGFYLILRES